jgi:hypothetical protein
VKKFRKFVDLFEDLKVTQMIKLILFGLLKAEGDVLMSINSFDRAIKCYKTMKDYCDRWGGMDY